MKPDDSRTITEQNRQAYDALAAAYAEKWVRQPDLALADQFLGLLNGDSILDVGCGPGQYSSYFLDHGCRVEAIDTSAAMIELAVQRDPRIRARQLDMAQLDYGDRVFDGLWVCASLPHIPAACVGAVLLGFRRVLKTDGCLLVNAIIGDLAYRVETPEEMGWGRDAPGRFFQWYPSPAAFRELVEQAGFTITAERQRSVTSRVLEHATRPTNAWYNCFCRPR